MKLIDRIALVLVILGGLNWGCVGIFGLCDETFSIHCTVDTPEGVDPGWFMFFVTVLNQAYWVAGATAGALLGYIIHFNTKGIEFVMTALFVVMFVSQWEVNEDHRPAVIGAAVTMLCLLVLGSDHFLLPAMALIVVCFLFLRRLTPAKKAPSDHTLTRKEETP